MISVVTGLGNTAGYEACCAWIPVSGIPHTDTTG